MPVAIDTTAFHGLPAFGARSPVVLTQSARRSPTFRYRLARERPKKTWLKLAFRLRVDLVQGGRNPGFAEITADTDGRPSGSVELKRTPDGRTRWTAAALHGGAEGVTRRPSARVAFTNYVRTVASTTGAHTLRFRLREWNGFRVRRVVVEPRTGLFLTHQPPQPLRLATTVQRPAGGDATSAFTIRVRIANTGVKPVTRVDVGALTGGDVTVAEVPDVERIAPGGSATVALTATPAQAVDHFVQVFAFSRLGGATAELTVPAQPPPAAAP
jgi:hypothetical protein